MDICSRRQKPEQRRWEGCGGGGSLLAWGLGLGNLASLLSAITTTPRPPRPRPRPRPPRSKKPNPISGRERPPCILYCALCAACCILKSSKLKA
jgi:hypothetical protein